MSERIGARGGNRAWPGLDGGHGRYARCGGRQGGAARTGAAA